MQSLVLIALASLISIAAKAEVKPDGAVLKTRCSNQVSTSVPVGAKNILLVSELCQAAIQGNNASFVTINEEVWQMEQLGAPASVPRKIQFVGKIGKDGLISWSLATVIITGTAKIEGDSIVVKAKGATYTGLNMEYVFHTESVQ